MRFVDRSLLAFPYRWTHCIATPPSGVLQGVVWHGEKSFKSVVLVPIIVKIVVLLDVVCVVCLCFVVTDTTNCIFGQSDRTLRTYGRTQDRFSTNNIATKHAKRKNDNDDHNDDDDGVSALHAAVNEERV